VAIVQGAIGQLPLARHDQDHESALAAAEAGVDDLSEPPRAERQLLDVQRPQSADAGQPRVHELGEGRRWLVERECFRYKADSSRTAATGLVYLTSSGKRLANPAPGSPCSGPGVIRTVSLGLRRQGFLDYLWLTDYEITDPALSGANATSCTFHAWEWNAAASKYGPNDVSACNVVYWTTLSVLNGPVHSNDGLYVCGSPTFGRRHRHLLRLTDEQQRVSQQAVRGCRHCAESAQLHRKRAGVRTQR